MKKVGQPLTDPIGRLVRTAGCFGGGIALLLLFCSPSSGDTVTQEGLSVKRHLQSFKQRFEKELYGTETHFFPIELSTREFLRVDIQSLNIDLAVSIVWPSR